MTFVEEVAKRQKTNAIAFDYNASLQPEKEEPQKDGIPTVPEKEEEDELYKPSPTLDVPVDINIVSFLNYYYVKIKVFTGKCGLSQRQ